MTSPRLLSILAAVAAAMLWGTTGTMQALLPEGRDPLAVGALRLLFGAASLLLLALAQPQSRRALVRLPWREILFAGVAIGGYNLLFFWAVTEAGVAVGTAVTIGSAPLWATAWEIARTRRLPRGLRAAGQLVSVLGVALLGLAAEGGSGSALGIVLALASGGCYAAYSLTTSGIGDRAPSTAIAAATFCVAALVAAPALALVPLAWLSGGSAWAALAFLGVGATGLSYMLYTWSLTRLAASTAVTLALIEPVTAWLLATLVVGETVTLQKTAGALLILAGLALVTAVPARHPER